jgi:ribosomal protein L11 methylase PrmA
LDGVPLDLAAKLLPRSAKLRPSLGMHIVIHSRAQKVKATEHKIQTRKVAQNSLEAILDSLERSIKKLKPRKNTTEWGDYYDKTNYIPSAADEKAQHLAALLKPLGIKTALDLGGNNGRYSRVLCNLGITTVCTDIDPNAVEANYLFVKQHKEQNMLPLVVDLTNPGGLLGWHNEEREAISKRLNTDAVMALALIHHLAISNNLPFGKIAEYFKEFGEYLVLEFVPKSDSQVQKLLSTRKDIFPAYNEKDMKQAFEEHYKLIKEVGILGTERTLHLFKRK